MISFSSTLLKTERVEIGCLLDAMFESLDLNIGTTRARFTMSVYAPPKVYVLIG